MKSLFKKGIKTMKEFHKYYLKIDNDKTEIYKDRKRIAILEDEEKAKSYIVNVLENETEKKQE